jgi:hypothetical protein
MTVPSPFVDQRSQDGAVRDRQRDASRSIFVMAPGASREKA